MSDIIKRIERIEEELSILQKGYISKKLINGKERYYLQWRENGKTKSKYIKESELHETKKNIEKRKALSEELKKLKNTREGKNIQYINHRAKKNIDTISGDIMSEDNIVASVKGGKITYIDQKKAPLYIKRTEDVYSWLSSRAIDSHRTHSRLLKKALRIKASEDAYVSLSVNAATITDTYWFRPTGSSAKYKDIIFKKNDFAGLALYGDPDSFSQKPSRTPELTNIGSFEKCWKLIDNEWWMYKNGTDKEFFSELFMSSLCKKLKIETAIYEMDGKYIRTKNFLKEGMIFEAMSSLTEDDDYQNCYQILKSFSKKIAKQYLRLIWIDTICYNMDRHTQNFGILRETKSGKIISLAPNFDNNISLISLGYPKDRKRTHDGIINIFERFLNQCPEAKEEYKKMQLPIINKKIIENCIDKIPIEVDREFIIDFILYGQDKVQKIINSDSIETFKDDFSLML